jgi:hypothetical protein
LRLCSASGFRALTAAFIDQALKASEGSLVFLPPSEA